MRLLIYEWESYLQQDIYDVCRDMKIEYKTITWKFEDKSHCEEFEVWFEKNVALRQYDAFFSINYFPLLSGLCQKNKVPYIAWCYDNPLNVIDIEKTLGNTVNHVFFFDRMQAKKYLDKGFRTVRYMPLAVNVKRLSSLKITKADWQKYASDVALVGSLYESRMQDILNLAGAYEQGYLKALMDVQQTIYGCYFFDELVEQSFVDGINRRIKKEHPKSEFVLLKEALTFAMASEVTRKERLLLLTMLANRFDTRLYSFQTSQVLERVKIFPPIDYISQMPKVFACTKVNLNPSLRCIQSGIPLRALDVMASGGFLLSNYQPELAEYFKSGEEVVVYDSIEDAIAKTDFYLRMDGVRESIMQRGRQKVMSDFSMKNRLEEILRDAIK